MPGLTTLEVRNAKVGRHADGRGLYLVVRDSGSRSWVLRAQVNGVRRDLGLGPALNVSLSAALAKRFGQRLLRYPNQCQPLPRRLAPAMKLLEAAGQISAIATPGLRRSKITSFLPSGQPR